MTTVILSVVVVSSVAVYVTAAAKIATTICGGPPVRKLAAMFGATLAGPAAGTLLYLVAP